MGAGCTKGRRGPPKLDPVQELLYEAKDHGDEDLERKLDKIRTLLDEGADVNFDTKFGSTPLNNALEEPSRGNAIALLLLERGADPKLISDGYSPLYWALERSNVDMVIKLLELGAVLDDGVVRQKEHFKMAEGFLNSENSEPTIGTQLITLIEMWEKLSAEERASRGTLLKSHKNAFQYVDYW
eukprot:gnl/TRDRNA2_/TRDRNA2_36230_c0_seq1.p2 gnl/TRDRNA2_/TRDRNA2_36230_c0~~gnl/TRDRNA2_/TRDRNA2_36230_c0_seq1.p2  ORF type:complete len:184 (-),score=31.94 gnl/TRDRNA2_/TRDRNA2_36230_c0_seq1:307-858(-)